MRIQKALIEDTISTKKAGLLLYSMQLALQNVGQTTFGQAKTEELVRATVDEEEAISENQRPLTTKDTKDAKEYKNLPLINADDRGFRQNQNPFTTEDAEATEENQGLPLMNTDDTERGTRSGDQAIARDRVIGKNGEMERPKPVEWKPTPDMYRMDTREGIEAYEASFRMKIEPRLDGQRRTVQAVIGPDDSAEVHANLG
jgi:hypothetical protein